MVAATGQLHHAMGHDRSEMKNLHVLVLIAGLLLAAFPISAQAAQPSFVFDNGTDAKNIPFELAGNHIYVRVQVNGGAPLWFLLDSGAAQNALIIVPESAPTSSASQKLATVALAGVTVNAQKLVSRPLGFASSDGHRLDGVLTYGFIRNFVVEINYAARTLNFYDPKNFHYAGSGERVKLTPLETDDGADLYLAALTLTSPDGRKVSGHFVVDTGVRLALSLNTPFVEAHDMLASRRRSVTAVVGSGLSITNTTLTLARLPAVAVGDIVVKDVITGFSRYKTGVLAMREFDGILGGEFLRRFRVFLDYSRSEMILEKNATFSEPYEYDMSGMLLLAEGTNFDAFRVHAVMVNSPASEAGLVEGDRIIEIDGKSASVFSLQGIQRLFRQNGRRHVLQITRGDQIIKVSLKLRRLI